MSTYVVWAKDKAAAIAKAQELAEAAGHSVTRAAAERYPEGAMYHVNWKVTLWFEDEA